MSETFAENKIDAEENKIQCCICYDDNSEEGNKGKLIECCPNKHILCIECFHKSYERKCECPLCRELMFRPEIMTDDEAFAYYSAKRALKQKKEREEQQRQFQLAEAERRRQEVERQRLEVERRRAEELARLPIRKTERKQIIQRRNDELMRQIATNNAEMENIDNLGLDEYNALYPPNFEQRNMPLNTISDSDSDSDTDDNVEIVYGPAPRPVVQQPVARPVQQPVPRPVQQPVPRPVQQPVPRPVPEPRPLTMHERERIEQIQQLIGRPVSLQIHPVARPAQVQQPVAARPPVQQPVQNPVAARPVPVQNPVAARPVPVQNPVAARPAQVQQPVAARPVLTQEYIRHLERPVQERRRSSTYAYEKLVHNELLVQTLRGQGMVVRYDRLNDRFIRVSDNTLYPTLHSASVAHAEEVGLSYHPNAWKTFKRLNGSSIDNL